MAYGFSPYRSLNLLSPPRFPAVFQACADATDAIFFALTNQKVYYNKKHQSLFLKVGDWAILRLYKGHPILSLLRVTKKLIQ